MASKKYSLQKRKNKNKNKNKSRKKSTKIRVGRGLNTDLANMILTEVKENSKLWELGHGITDDELRNIIKKALYNGVLSPERYSYYLAMLLRKKVFDQHMTNKKATSDKAGLNQNFVNEAKKKFRKYFKSINSSN